MLESISSYWQGLTDENKTFVKRIGIASIALYVLLQLVTLLLPIAFTAGIGFLVYKNVIDKNPKVLK